MACRLLNPLKSKNAGKTLIIMTVLMAVLFIGSIGLTQYLGVIAGADETILSALARRILGSGFLYYLVQISTMLILTVAANTSFAGFPRLAAILAKDGFLPRQFTGLGDRLVFANGIGLLAVATGLLIILFGGSSHLLIPLFAVGVFIAYTLSQVGMVRHWWRERGRGWWVKAGINGIGALVTCLALLIIAASKFLHGAWISLLLILLLVSFFYKVRSHYRRIGTGIVDPWGQDPPAIPEATAGHHSDFRYSPGHDRGRQFCPQDRQGCHGRLC